MPDPNDPRDAGTYDELRVAGRELTPEELKWMEEYEAAKQTGGFPIGGSVSGRIPMQPTPPRGALHMGE